jgi:DNA-binding protein YbaB
MGASKSKTVVETNVVNESTFNAVSKSENAVSASVITVQNMAVRGVTAYCNLDVSQKINADIKVLQKFDEKSTQDLLTKIMNDVEQKAKDSVKQKTGFMNPIPNFSSRSSEVKTNIVNKVTKNITSETLNKLAAKVINKQKLVTENLIIDPLGLSVYKSMGVPPPIELMKEIKNTKCKIGQDAQIKFVAEQIGSKITEIINKDESAQKLKKEIDASTSQETQGAGEAVAQGAKGIGEGVGAIFKGGTGASIVSGIVSCVCCGAILAFGMSPAGQSLSKNAGAKAMKRF